MSKTMQETTQNDPSAGAESPIFANIRTMRHSIKQDNGTRDFWLVKHKTDFS